MNNAEKQYDVSITNTTNGWGWCDINVLPCKPMTAKEIKTYMNKINHYKEIPLDSCLYYISFDFQDTHQRKISFSTLHPHKYTDQRSLGGFFISVQMKNCQKCSNKDCFNNIDNGKCTDKFVCEIIGKYLFKEKYENQK